MSEALSYAEPGVGSRWSRRAIAAFSISVAALPFFIAVLYIIGPLPLPEAARVVIVLTAFFVPAILGAVLGLFALCRGLASRGRLKGWWLGLIGMLLSMAWPVGVVWYVLEHLPTC